MRSDLRTTMIGLFSMLPLLALTVWAYAPATAYDYPTVRELLLNPYNAAAAPDSVAGLRFRQLAVLMCTFLLFALINRGTQRNSQAVLAGALASAVPAMPLLVPAVLQGDQWGIACIAMSAAGGIVLAIRLLAQIGPALAGPLAAIVMLAASVSTVYTAAEVTLRSNPPLFVLANAARSPESLQAQLALGMHLLYVGGDQEAQPIILDVGERLVERYTDSGEDDLLAVAKELVLWARETGANRAATMPSQKTE